MHVAASVYAMLQALGTQLPPLILLVVFAAEIWLLLGAFYSRVCIAIGVLCLRLASRSIHGQTSCVGLRVPRSIHYTGSI